MRAKNKFDSDENYDTAANKAVVFILIIAIAFVTLIIKQVYEILSK